MAHWNLCTKENFIDRRYTIETNDICTPACIGGPDLLFCTGCSARTPVTAEEFETQASAVGFTVETPSVDPETYVSARTAYDQTIDMQIDFAVCKDQETATTTYNGLKEYIGEPKTAERTTNVDSAAYSKYTVENGELYFVIARIEDTVLYGTGKLAQRNKMDELLSAIQY